MEEAIPIQVKDQTIPAKETVDEYLRRGGKINRVPPGASANFVITSDARREQAAYAQRKVEKSRQKGSKRSAKRGKK